VTAGSPPQQVFLREIDHLVAAAAHDGADEPQAEALDLLQLDGGRYRELLLRGDGVEDGGAVMGEQLPDRAGKLAGIFGPDRMDALFKDSGSTWAARKPIGSAKAPACSTAGEHARRAGRALKRRRCRWRIRAQGLTALAGGKVACRTAAARLGKAVNAVRFRKAGDCFAHGWRHQHCEGEDCDDQLHH
jgi:hypothetical protein